MQAQDCSLQNGGTALMVLVAFDLDPRRCLNSQQVSSSSSGSSA